MSREIMVTFCIVNMALCFSVFAIIYFRYAKSTKKSRSKPFFKDLEDKYRIYKEHLKQLDQERKHVLAGKSSGTQDLGLDKLPKNSD